MRIVIACTCASFSLLAACKDKKMDAEPTPSAPSYDPGDVVLQTPNRVRITALALDGDQLYVARLDRTHVRMHTDFIRVPAAGGAETVLASTNGSAMHLAVDDTSVFAATIDGLIRIPKQGVPDSERWNPAAWANLSKDALWGGWVALTPDSVIFEKQDHAVAKVPKSGGNVEVVLDAGSAINGLAADRDAILVARDSKIIAIPPGGKGTMVADGTGPIAVDEQSIYFVGNGLRAVPRRGGASTVLMTHGHGGCGLAVRSRLIVACVGDKDGDRLAVVPKTGVRASEQPVRIDAAATGTVADDAHIYGYECHPVGEKHFDAGRFPEQDEVCMLHRWPLPVAQSPQGSSGSANVEAR